MAKNKIPKTLPECELLSILAEKVSQRHDIDFNFFGRLDEFRQRVSGEVRQINALFPEYTPHDEQYHLKRLHHVADTVLGRDQIEAMNSAELFLLTVALYGHDWGMAVSEPEMEYITAGRPREGVRAEDLWILSDEQHRFSKFSHEQGLKTDTKEISIELWREYVRRTHAFRSGERVRRFFDPIDPGIADASSRICIGHWLDFEDMEDYRSYPADFSVLREAVNLRALTVYLRLIDLLDLADDRTPYVIWKFVAPRDPHSKMEWTRHRALRPVTCPQYQAGRIIRVDGSTDDHEVYAALEDLRIWCGEQLRGCNDVLARMNDPRHKLDLYHIDWRVAARGFRPVSIQFEFDRERMFEILSDEIYQGDPYVFLRELLQNSIDAIRMRREVLQRKGIDPGNLGVIQVTVDHREGGDTIITWQDDGIGMDEYIIRNYLAVAGKSYYTSTDFEREGLKMDPISRFGVGILSCFMVADRIQIETFRDPYLPPRGEPIRITIPAVRRQFRIETLSQELGQVGTTVKVFVEGKKLSTGNQEEPVQQLDVTGYLSEVAGFVEFPVVVKEKDRKTIVLHPNQNPDTTRQRFGKEFEVHQLDLSYPWDKAILPQDIPTARKFLREHRWDIASDLGLAGCNGILTCLIPTNGVDIKDSHDGSEVVLRGKKQDVVQRVRVTEPIEALALDVDKKLPSVGLIRKRMSWAYAVYRDGILLATMEPPISFMKTFALPLPRMIVNLSQLKAPRVDLARRQILGEERHWDSALYKAYLRCLSESLLKDLYTMELAERLYQLGRIIGFYRIDAESIWRVFPQKHLPLSFLEAKGHLTFLEWQAVASEPLYLLPEILETKADEIHASRWIYQKEYDGVLTNWAAERCLCAPSRKYGTSLLGMALASALDLCRLPVQINHRYAAARFLNPPWEGDPPLLQEIWVPVQTPEIGPDIEAILERAVEDPARLNPAEIALLGKELPREFPKITEFCKPFDKFFAYGDKAMNMKHPITQAIVRFEAAVALSKRRRILTGEQIGQLEDGMNSLIHNFPFREPRREPFSRALQHFFSLLRNTNLLDVDQLKDLVPAQEEFIPGTTESDFDNLVWRLRNKASPKPFGEPLT